MRSVVRRVCSLFLIVISCRLMTTAGQRFRPANWPPWLQPSARKHPYAGYGRQPVRSARRLDQSIEQPDNGRQVFRMDKFEAAATKALVDIPASHPAIGGAFIQTRPRGSTRTMASVLFSIKARKRFSLFWSASQAFLLSVISRQSPGWSAAAVRVADECESVQTPESAGILAVHFQFERGRDG